MWCFLLQNQSGPTLQIKERHKSPLDATSSASSPKVWLEPVEYLMARENYKEISTLRYKKNPRVKSYRELSLNHNTIDTMYKLSNMRKLWVCDYCSMSFLCQISLKTHYKLKHGLSDKKRIYKKRASRTSIMTRKSSVSDSFSEDDLGSCGKSSAKARSSFSSPSSCMFLNNSLDSEDVTDCTSSEMTYVWERKKLGVYKATTFCNSKTGLVKGLESKRIGLDKLTVRLDEMVQS